MKFSFSTLANIFLAGIFVSSMFLIGITTSINSYSALPGEYDPWCDLNDDGDINIYDIVDIAGRYGTTGEPFAAKAALEYDSGWININDKAGQYFNVTHNLNSTDIIVDIQGKTTLDDGVHQRNLGGTGYLPGWSRTYGGNDQDYFRSMIRASDGGYAILGSTASFSAGDRDFWLVKTDSAGNLEWNKTYGGVNDDGVYGGCIIQTSDGGYAIAGDTDSGFGTGKQDFWLVRTDAVGNIQWNKTYSRFSFDIAHSMVQTSDGGYALAGRTYQPDAEVYHYDFWLVKTDADGNMQWNKTYGGTNDDLAYSIVQIGDGGYAIAGHTQSFGAGQRDLWLVKTDSTGNMEWNKTYGGTNDDLAYSIVQTVDGGYALGGYTESFGAGSGDFWLVKTDSTGNMQWNKTYGGTDIETAWSVVQASDGGYAIAGIKGLIYPSYVWLVKTDTNGNAQWTKTYEGPCPSACSLAESVDGGYAIACGVFDVAWNMDLLLIKTELWEYGLIWTDSTSDSIILHRGTEDVDWNYVRVRIWKIKETP